MKTVAGALISFGVVLFFLTSCTTTPPLQLKTGEMRLLRVEMPEVIEEDLPYDVVVTFEAQGEPEIKNACFQWLTETTAVKSPSLYCYASEVQDNAPIGSSCSRWLAEGRYSRSSPIFCAKIVSVDRGIPSRFIVKIQSQNIELHYNKLECYAEYLQNGELKQTNRVGTRIRVEQ